MISGRYQSIEPKEIPAFRAKQIEAEQKRRPLYGMGKHVPGNKKPGQYRGGHKYSSGRMQRGTA